MSETPIASQGQPQVTGQMFLYRRPVLLSAEAHGHLGMKQVERPFEFCGKIRAAPITVSEIPIAAKTYPVVFASLEQPMPLAILGIIDDANLFVDDNGVWERHAYIPGYIRRYPFGVARDEKSDRYAVVLDGDFEGLDPDAESRLFNGKETTAFTKDAIEFTKGYEDDRRLTERAVDALKKTGLLTIQTAQYTPTDGGEARAFAQYVGVDEAMLKDLDDAKFLELRKTGILPLLYLQLASMANWRMLMARRAERFKLSEAEFLNPVASAKA